MCGVASVLVSVPDLREVITVRGIATVWVTSVIWLALLVLLKNLGIQGVGVNKSFPYRNRATHVVWCLTVPYSHCSTIVLKNPYRCYEAYYAA